MTATCVVGGSFDGNEIEAGKVVLATGSVSKPLLGLEFGDRILDTAACWHLSEQPKRLAVIGAGASGTEIASAFGRMGTEVVLLEALAADPAARGRGDRAPRGARAEEAEHRDRHRRERGGRRGREVVGEGDLRRRHARVRLPVHRRRPRSRRRRPRPRQGGREDGRARPRHGGRARCARRPRTSTRSATWCPAPRSRTRPPTRA